jgi:hypothetical protein
MVVFEDGDAMLSAEDRKRQVWNEKLSCGGKVKKEAH